MTDKFEQGVVELIRKQRFYAEMLLRMKRTIDKTIPTIGVGFKNDGIDIVYNPYFLNNLSLNELVDVLIHECLHILNGHFEREKDLEPEFDRMKAGKTLKDRLQGMQHATRLNMAEDYAINEFLPNLPRKFNLFDEKGNAILNQETQKPQEFEGCFVDNLQKQMPDKNIQKEQAMEYYYAILKDQEKENKQNGDGEGTITITLDDHSVGSLQDDMDAEFAKEMAKTLVNNSLEACSESERGSMPGHLQKLIDQLNYKPKDWRGDLRKFVAKCAEAIIEPTRRKRNRRYGTLYPGSRIDPKLKLAAGFDTSGSMSDEVCEQIVAELNQLHNLGVKITVIQCDSEIKSVEDFNPKAKIEIHGRGGTQFSPVFNLINSKKFTNEYGEIDGLLFFTDGYNYDDNAVQKPKYPVMWGVTDGGKISYDWGFKTEVKVRRK